MDLYRKEQEMRRRSVARSQQQKDHDSIRAKLFRYIDDNFDCNVYDFRRNGVVYSHVEAPLFGTPRISSSQFDETSRQTFIDGNAEQGKFWFTEVQRSKRDPKKFLALLERRGVSGHNVSCYLTNDVEYAKTHETVFPKSHFNPLLPNQIYVLTDSEGTLVDGPRAAVVIAEDRSRRGIDPSFIGDV